MADGSPDGGEKRPRSPSPQPDGDGGESDVPLAADAALDAAETMPTPPQVEPGPDQLAASLLTPEVKLPETRSSRRSSVTASPDASPRQHLSKPRRVTTGHTPEHANRLLASGSAAEGEGGKEDQPYLRSMRRTREKRETVSRIGSVPRNVHTPSGLGRLSTATMVVSAQTPLAAATNMVSVRARASETGVQPLTPERVAAVHDSWRSVVEQERAARERLLAENREQQRLRELAAHASTAFESQAFDEAVDKLSQTLELSPGSDLFLRFRARAHLRAGRVPDAVSDVRRAADLQPSRADNLLLLGTAHLRDGALGDAGRAYTRAMRLDASGTRGELGYKRVVGLMHHRRYFWQAAPGRAVPRLFDPRLHISDPSQDSVAHKELRAPAAPPQPVVDFVDVDSVTVSWTEPEDDGGDEVFEFVLECSWYEVAWSPELNDIFDGMREFQIWHKGPAKVRKATFTDLAADNPFVFRVRCANSLGESPCSEATLVRTRKPAAKAPEIVTAPPAWLMTDYADILKQHSDKLNVPGDHILRELREVLDPRADRVHLAFRLFCVLNSKDVTNVREMQRAQFNNVCRLAGLLDDGSLDATQVDLVFQRANMDFRGDAKAKEKADKDDGGVDSMVETEFVNALVRLGNLHFGSSPTAKVSLPSLAARTERLLDDHIIPAFEAALPSDDFLAVVKSRRTRAILLKHAKVLRHIFATYAAADVSSQDARASTATINMDELIFMVKEGGLLDNNLTLAKVAYIFTIVNVENALKSAEQLAVEGVLEAGARDQRPGTAASGAGARAMIDALGEDADDDEDELVYAEWCDALVRMVNEKHPENTRAGMDFPKLLDWYLEMKFIPKFTQLIKDKKRGIAAKHL